ncbi:MAG TPA: type II toxin-antitoxin system HicA family toxin [Terracidiphilus sp.]|jgi:predicted RNA binding protein YcfA (HicA-like mRNA interferase family)
MSHWPSTSAKNVYRALLRIGWREKPRISKSGSHKHLEHDAYPKEFTWSFHDSDEIGPKMLARIAK